MKVYYRDLEGQLWEDKCFGNSMDEFVRKEEAEEELRRTKRALWIARAERARAMMHVYAYNAGKYPKWQAVERKCREKAEYR